MPPVVRPALALALVLSACTGDPPAGDTESSGNDDTTAAPTTGTPTTGAPTTGEDTTGASSESSGDGTTEIPIEPLPPLGSGVPLTDEQVLVPTHPVDDEKLIDPRIPADVGKGLDEGYGEVVVGPGEPVLPRTLDDAPAPAPGPSPKLLTRFVHLADTQLADDESPSRLATFDEVSGGAFRPQEGHLCRMLNAAVRTVNRIHEDLPIGFVLLGGDNTDNAHTNELDWFLRILDGAPRVECDSATDDDPVPGPDNDPKDPFGPVALDVPWRWVTGNHDILRQGTWSTFGFEDEPTGTMPAGGTRDYSMPGSPITMGPVPADPRRAFIPEEAQLKILAESGDGHGITAEALALGRAFYTFDVEGTPLRFFVIDTASITGGSKGLIRQVDIDAIIEPTLQAAADDDKLVIISSHHRASSLDTGAEFGIGIEYDDALLTEDWESYLGGHDHVIMHLAAHTHILHVEPKTPLGGHAYWEMASPALSDYPHQLRMIEVWDQDNGSLTIRSVAFDFATDGDPVAEAGRTLGVLDFTASWEKDGRGELEDRNVELWIAKP